MQRRFHACFIKGREEETVLIFLLDSLPFLSSDLKPFRTIRIHSTDTIDRPLKQTLDLSKPPIHFLFVDPRAKEKDSGIRHASEVETGFKRGGAGPYKTASIHATSNIRGGAPNESVPPTFANK